MLQKSLIQSAVSIWGDELLLGTCWLPSSGKICFHRTVSVIHTHAHISCHSVADPPAFRRVALYESVPLFHCISAFKNHIAHSSLRPNTHHDVQQMQRSMVYWSPTLIICQVMLWFDFYLNIHLIYNNNSVLKVNLQHHNEGEEAAPWRTYTVG